MCKLLGVLQDVQSGVCKVQTVCEFRDRSKSRESIIVDNRGGEYFVFLAFLLLFGLSTPSVMSAFLFVVSIGILLSGNPTIGSGLSAIFMFVFVRHMLLLLEGKRWIGRLGFNCR